MILIILVNKCQFYQFTKMNDTNYPIPHSHKTFQFGNITLDSNFDSGNLYDAQKINNSNYNLWIAVDHIKNQYKSWFHFSIKGLKKGTLVTFNIKNMGNQIKLLNQGLVPVFRPESCKQWNRIAHKVDLSKIEHCEGWIQWSFKHTMTSDEKVFLAIFYPWSNTENDQFLKNIQAKCLIQQDIYFKRSNIIKSLEGRPVEFLTITSKKGISNKSQKFEDEYLFPNKDEPKQFITDKKCFIISARVHPGEVPSSHVMTGIIQQLTENTEQAKILRDRFIFYIFPILNPDGVARGHYRVDPNGINLNRCYINPSPKNHSPIYAIKKIIIHFHNKNRYFGFLDLHAHAARKGVFIYGNSTNELQKQVEICLFPKILSMNSEIFEYEGSNFTEKNMYCKDINDHVSKQGAGRVAIFKSTKNPYAWTLQCNYNTSRVINVIDQRRKKDEPVTQINEKELDTELIVNYRYPTTKQPKEFYTIEHFKRLGKEICESLLDLIELNPMSRIDNPRSHFKCVQNLKLNLAVSLLKMAPNRFQSQFKKLYYYLQNNSASKQFSERTVKALYLLLIKKAKIQNLSAFLKDNDISSVVYPKPSISKRHSMSPIKQSSSPIRAVQSVKPVSKDLRPRINPISPKRQNSSSKTRASRQNFYPEEVLQTNIIRLNKISKQFEQSDDSQQQDNTLLAGEQVYHSIFLQQTQQAEKQAKRLETLKLSAMLNSQLLQVNFDNNYQRILGRQNEIGIDILRSYRKSFVNESKKLSYLKNQSGLKFPKSSVQQLPCLALGKAKAVVSISSIANQIRFVKNGKKRQKEENLSLSPNAK